MLLDSQMESMVFKEIVILNRMISYIGPPSIDAALELDLQRCFGLLAEELPRAHVISQYPSEGSDDQLHEPPLAVVLELLPSLIT